MQKIILFLGCMLVFGLAASGAKAEPKPTYWTWWPGHWKNQEFKPHLDDPKTPHNSQWKALWTQDQWRPENWVNDRGSAEAIIQDFYNAGIIREQTDDDDVPVLVVGDGFMNLSGQEKRRVTDFIDYVYHVTEQSPNGLFYIYYDRTERLFTRGNPVGVYTADGLQLQ